MVGAEGTVGLNLDGSQQVPPCSGDQPVPRKASLGPRRPASTGVAERARGGAREISGFPKKQSWGRDLLQEATMWPSERRAAQSHRWRPLPRPRPSTEAAFQDGGLVPKHAASASVSHPWEPPEEEPRFWGPSCPAPTVQPAEQTPASPYFEILAVTDRIGRQAAPAFNSWLCFP